VIPGVVRSAKFASKRLQQPAKEIDADLVLNDTERGREDAEFADVIHHTGYLTCRNIQFLRVKRNGYGRTRLKFKNHRAVWLAGHCSYIVEIIAVVESKSCILNLM
jgi:hypothetical protein